MGVVYWLATTNRIVAPVIPRRPIPEIGIAFIRAAPALFAPVFLIGGILTGLATPTQLGALTAVYAIILGVCTRDLTFKTLQKAIRDTFQLVEYWYLLLPPRPRLVLLWLWKEFRNKWQICCFQFQRIQLLFYLLSYCTAYFWLCNGYYRDFVDLGSCFSSGNGKFGY